MGTGSVFIPLFHFDQIPAVRGNQGDISLAGIEFYLFAGALVIVGSDAVVTAL